MTSISCKTHCMGLAGHGCSASHIRAGQTRSLRRRQREDGDGTFPPVSVFDSQWPLVPTNPAVRTKRRPQELPNLSPAHTWVTGMVLADHTVSMYCLAR